MTQKHREIIREIQRLGGEATAYQLYERFAVGYYANGKKYVLAIVSTLVKQKKLIRIKPGVYRLNVPQDIFST